jgi:cysteine desulfurase / selenocysteine lyase
MTAAKIMHEIEQIRDDFPGLAQSVYGQSLVYLDNAATTQKPRQVLEAMQHLYEHDCANVHRGVHALSERATKSYEDVRVKVQHFLNAPSKEEIIFTRGATEAINLVAQSFGQAFVRAGDEVVVSEMEHHSNIVPWQMLCERYHAHLKVIPMTDAGELDLAAYIALLSDKTRLVAVTHVSNALGTINPIVEMIAAARARNIAVLVDGSQAAAHFKIDVQKLDCDFYVFSGHKVYGPFGTGALYGKKALLNAMPPFLGGGDMIRSVTFDKTTYAALPAKFEAGTPNIAGIIGLGAAIDYLQSLDWQAVQEQEHALTKYAMEKLGGVVGLRFIGTAKNRIGVISFVLGDIHPHDIGTVVDREGIAIRAGHHCAQPVMQHYGIPASVRVSLGLYNTREDIDRLVNALDKVRTLFK